MRLRFAGFVLDPDRFELRRGGRRVAIEPKPLRLLILLASQPGRAVPSEELHAALWPDVAVERDSLHRAVGAARRALAAAGGEPGLLRTVRGRGYLLSGVAPALAQRARADPFVGRRRELGALARALAAALGGAGGVVLVSGEPGIGKTRLAHELAARAQSRGVAVWWGRGFEAEEAPPYGLWRQVLGAFAALRSSRRLRAELGPEAPELAASFPELAAGLGELPAPAQLDPAQSRYRLFESTARFLARAAHAQPWLVLLDDLHAADLPSLLLLRHLGHELGALRVLVVATLRPLDVPAALARPLEDLRRERGCETLELGPLSQRESRQLAARLGQRAAAAPLIARSDGNPFFLRELVRDTRGGAPRAAAVPYSVRQMIELRVAALSAASREVLVAASVLGARFALAPLASLCRVRGPRLLAALAEAERAGLVGADRERPGERRFQHALVSDAVYASGELALRARLHRRAARVLAAHSDPDAGELHAELARHHLGAGGPADLARAVEHSLRAAEHAASLAAFEVAALHHLRAVDALAASGSRDDAHRCALLLHLAEALERSGDAVEAVRRRKQVLAIARAARLAAPFAEAACALTNENVLEADDAERLAALEEARAWPGLPDALRARVLAALCRQLIWSGDLAKRRALHAEAVAVARRVGDRGALLSVFTGDPLIALDGDDALRRRQLAEWRDLARELHDGERECMTWLLALTDRIASADADGIERELAGFRRRVEELRHPRFRYWVAVACATRALWRGPLAEAEALVAKARSLAHPVDEQPATQGTWRMQLSLLRQLQGRFREALALVEEAIASHPSMGLLHAMHPLALALADRFPEARAVFEALVDGDGLELQHPGRELSLALLAEACAKLGDVSRGARLRALLLPSAGRYASVYASYTHGCVSRPLGLLAWLLGEREEAVRHFEDALAIERRLEARPWLALTELDYARLLRELGAPAAGRHAARAVRLGRAVGMAHVVAGASRRAEAPPRPREGYGLPA
jgi:DNA-binding winged helix-turn-helix (wHTH) protein/tetratricopeptide (TPR) repeat protein